jgi:hypothetical protein
MTSAKLFINYRREDTAPYAGRLYDRLVARFGKETVFIDIDQIEPGEDFVDAIDRKVGVCDIAIALIGPKWLRVTDAAGKRRIDDSEDFVRMEIVAALERKIRVIPVLVGGASMPQKKDLPEALTLLSRRNAIELSETRFHADVDRLIQAIEKLIVSGEKTPDLQSRTQQTSEFLESPKSSKPAVISPKAIFTYRRLLVVIGIAIALGYLAWFVIPRPSSETKLSAVHATVIEPVVSTVPPGPSPSPQYSPPAVSPPTDRRIKENKNLAAEENNGNNASIDLGPTIWRHNGSTVILKKNGSQLLFVYRHVRSGLQGIIPDGVTLFEGVAAGDRVSGKARRFKKGLPTLEYEVSGSSRNNGKVIELTGNYPKRDDNGHIIEYVPETLRFDYIGPAE